MPRAVGDSPDATKPVFAGCIPIFADFVLLASATVVGPK
jgi:hypothetical protein